jgi:hypothetical protein
MKTLDRLVPSIAYLRRVHFSVQLINNAFHFHIVYPDRVHIEHSDGLLGLFSVTASNGAEFPRFASTLGV